MTLIQTTERTLEALVKEFFQRSEGTWESQRRVYTLKQQGEPEEVTSYLTIRYLGQGSPELRKLANLHGLEDENALLSLSPQ